MRNVCRTAEFVVYGPVPHRVGMSVEKHSALDFARAFLDCRHAVSRFFGETFVDKFLVKTELNEQNHKAESRNYRAEYRKKEKRHHTDKHERNRKVYPTEKRVGVFLERLDVATLATAIVLEEVRHILASHFFAFATGVAFWHIVADMRDFIAHKLRALRLVVNKTL